MQIRFQKNRIVSGIAAALILAMTVTAAVGFLNCDKVTAADADQEKMISAADLNGKKAGAMVGTPQDQMIEKFLGEKQDFSYFNSLTDMLMALREGKIDYFAISDVNYLMVKDEYPDISIIEDEPINTLNIGAIFPKNEKGEALRAQYNEYIADLKSDGDLETMKKIWFSDERKSQTVDIPTEGANGTLKVAICSTMEPFAFMSGTGYSGYEISLLAGFAETYGYGLDIDDSDFSGELAGVGAGKYDMAASQISYTQERAESVLFSDSVYEQQIVFFVRTQDLYGSYEDEDKGLVTSIKEGFYKSFIREERWKLVASGLLTTLGITLTAAVFGTFLGFALCQLLRVGKGPAAFARFYMWLFQGMPIVVLLMIMYYLVFGASKMPAFWVAALSFGLNFAAFVAQIMFTGVESVDPGQREAALSLGFTERKSHFKFILPQALENVLPVYRAQIVTLLKGTAVVGYISVQDLTRAGDLIRSRTYEAFFPLITTAILYFVLAYFLIAVLNLIASRFIPDKHKRDPKRSSLMKGVTLR